MNFVSIFYGFLGDGKKVKYISDVELDLLLPDNESLKTFEVSQQ